MLRAMILILSILLTTTTCVADQVTADSVDSTSMNSQLLAGLGSQISSYKYAEPGLMELRGLFNRINGFLTWEINSFQISTEVTAGFGNVDYYGSISGDDGIHTPYTLSGIKDRLYEFRMMIGKSLSSGSRRFIPAIGYGVRYLDDLSGEKQYAYDRHSKYNYIPLKMQIIQSLSKQKYGSQLSLIIEYDHLLYGVQKTDLSDLNGSYISGDTLGVQYPNIRSNQNGGNGTRFSLSWNHSTQPGKVSFQISVYYESWHIDESSHTIYERTILMRDPVEDIVHYFEAWEPKNRTREIGFAIHLTKF